MKTTIEKGWITMDFNTANGDTWLQLNFGFFNPATGYMEKLDAWVSDDSDFSDPMKWILIATPISLSLWAVIILVLSKLI